MKKILLLALIVINTTSFAQVYNYGADEITFKELIANGITYVRTGDSLFDAHVIEALENHWTITEFSVGDQYKRPEKTSTALFITTKDRTGKHMSDRKNQHVLVMQPAEIYVPRKDVKMEETLGYMYLNGFYDLVAQEDEYRYVYILVQSLNRGISLIKEKRLIGEPDDLNDKINDAIRGEDGPSVGHTLILNREQTRHAILTPDLDKLNIDYRLLAEEEYYETLAKKDPSHLILYFAVNRFTEMALVKLESGKTLYAKHFRGDYATLDKKELKEIAGFFLK
jgi:hypothetical protein